MFRGLVGLTAIEVSLCGLFTSQSVLTFGVACVGVVQIAVPVLVAGAPPKTAPATGAGASVALWVKSTGCGSSSAVAGNAAAPTASATVPSTAAARTALGRLPLMSPKQDICPLLPGWKWSPSLQHRRASTSTLSSRPCSVCEGPPAPNHQYGGFLRPYGLVSLDVGA